MATRKATKVPGVHGDAPIAKKPKRRSPSTGSPPKKRSRNGRVKQEKRVATDAEPINPRKGECSDGIGADCSRVSVGGGLKQYEMTHARRGKAVIFNHLNFDGQEDKKRRGTEIDAKSLQETLEKLEFEVEICKDYTFTKIQKKIKKLTEEKHDDCDCLFVAVLTHGGSNSLSDRRNYHYDPKEIWGPFSSGMCPSLAGKPKIFIIQACRGGHIDKGGTVKRSSKLQTDNAVSSGSYRIPSMADFLIGFSCFDGYVSYRHAEKGTCYIQSLCNVLNHNYPFMDLQKMLTKVADTVAAVDFVVEDEAKNAKQAPTTLSTLTREVIFTPKKTD